MESPRGTTNTLLNNGTLATSGSLATNSINATSTYAATTITNNGTISVNGGSFGGTTTLSNNGTLNLAGTISSVGATTLNFNAGGTVNQTTGNGGGFQSFRQQQRDNQHHAE